MNHVVLLGDSIFDNASYVPDGPPVIDQLRQFGETRRGWLGVRIQQVTDDIAESLSIKPARGALVAGVEDKGPAKPADIQPGDVIVRFDGKDIKEMRDLPRVVADTPVGKVVDVVVIRKGKQETHKVAVGRLQDTEKIAEASAKQEAPPDKSVVQKTLGLELSELSDDQRQVIELHRLKGLSLSQVAADQPHVDFAAVTALRIFGQEILAQLILLGDIRDGSRTKRFDGGVFLGVDRRRRAVQRERRDVLGRLVLGLFGVQGWRGLLRALRGTASSKQE